MSQVASIADGATPHPFDQASPAELQAAVDIVKQRFDPELELFWYAGNVQEPPKKVMQEYLRAERAGKPIPPPPRRICILVGIVHTPRNFEVLVDLREGVIVGFKELSRIYQPPLTMDEVDIARNVTLSSDLVKKEAERMGIPMDLVFAEPWDYGRDSDEEYPRMSQIFMYMLNPETRDPESNPYSWPLDFMAIVDLEKREVVKVIHLNLGVDTVSREIQNGTYKGSKPIEPEYVHSLQSQKTRTTMKPLRVLQPEGPSFDVSGNLIEWEKWRFRVGFNWREGFVLYDVTFDGREVLYRMSLAEMFVPYGDPRSPLQRKSAFDFGNIGAGNAANNLGLGCDCLGVIKYLDGQLLGGDGKPKTVPNVVCIHEVDAGIQWKHTNTVTGKPVVVRRRQLQLQMIITVANYEYAFYYVFDQSGEIMFDTLATGIRSTTPIDPTNKDPCSYGTRVAPGVLAPYHQHIFSLRIDPCIDGDGNTVQVVDSVPMPLDKDTNPYGVGYTTESYNVKQSGTEDINVERGRVFKIVNPNKINPTTLQPVGYKLVPVASQMILSDPNSWHGRRSNYCTAPIWVTKYKDDELYPAGKYTSQSIGDDGLRHYISRNDPVENEDIVVWHTFGLTHNPRPEDFPIMPAETSRVMLKPYGFFEYNPTLDVPESKQSFNQSVSYEDSKALSSKKSCCKI